MGGKIMDHELKEKFQDLWRQYFAGSELPVAVYYTRDVANATLIKPAADRGCFIAQLKKARKGKALAFNSDSIGCSGGKKYLGFSDALRPGFEFFLSCGIPGKMEGERYKKTPEIVKDLLKNAPKFQAPADYIVFKRWDLLDETDQPEIVIFFAKPDVLAGLFGLVNYDRSDAINVIAPMSSGCGALIMLPYLQIKEAHPKAVLGMFDPSARPFIEADELSFAMPMKRFQEMTGNMQESFLITPSWETIRRRMIRTE
jgi:uncharacterized protein (DUF169 family)